MHRRLSKVFLSLAVAVAFVAAGCSSSSKSSSTSTTASGAGSAGGSASTSSGSSSGAATGSPISIGFIYSATGLAQPSYVNSEYGAQAYVDALNAAGGVKGHPLKLVIKDDASTPTGNATAAQFLVQTDHVFGIIDDSSFTFASTKYLQQNGIPVIGAAIDGGEWQTPPNTNMFSVFPVTTGPVQGKFYSYDNAAPFLKSVGVTKLGALGNNFPSVVAAEAGVFKGAEAAGIAKCYGNSTLPLGGTDFTAQVLQLKAAGCNGVYAAVELGSSIALAQALKNAGMSAVQVHTTAYDQNVLSQPSALASLTGTYTTSSYNVSPPSGASATMMQRLAQYTAFKGTIPSLNIAFAYASADLFTMGLKMTGNTSRSDFITSLHTVGNYSAGGLFATAVSFQNFGTAQSFLPTGCEYYFKIESSGFQPTNGGKPWCGNLISVNA